jgi:long-subunit fatty acid transport protein
VAALGLYAGAAPARATPLGTSAPGGPLIGSPVEPHPASILRNPAVIGLLRGTHVYVSGTARLEHGRIQRSAIRSDTGNPGAGADLQFEPVSFLHVTPEGYLGLTTDLGSELVVIGIALATPFAEMKRYGGRTAQPTPAEEGALRYHRIRSDWFHLFVAPAVAVRLHPRFHVGLGFYYVRSMLRLDFARDRKLRTGLIGANAPLYEDPQATERLSVSGAEDSFCFDLGLLVRLPGAVDVGLSYRSKVAGVNLDHVQAEGDARVTRYEAASASWVTYQGRARIAYELPDSLQVGVRWTHRRWALLTSFEWERWSVHRRLSYTLTGNELRAAGMTNWDLGFAEHRGWTDVFRVAASASYRVSDRLQVSFGLDFESSAVPSRWVSAAQIDGHQLGLAASLTWRPHRSVGFTFGYGLGVSADVGADPSGYDPGYVVRCVEDHVDILWSESCRITREGRGLPTAAGRYLQVTHRLGLGVSYDHW